MLRNAHDILADGLTAYEARFGEPFDVVIVPFGASVEYKPSSKADTEKLPELGKKTCEGLCTGCCQKAGCGWDGDVDILDGMELKNAGDIDDVHTKRISADEMTVTKKNGEVYFPVLVEG